MEPPQVAQKRPPVGGHYFNLPPIYRLEIFLSTALLMDVVSLAVVFISQTSFYILIPPFLCGALTVILFSSCTFLPFADGASIGLITGVAGGIILIILGTPVTYLIPGGIDQMHLMNWNPFAAGLLQMLSAMGVLGIANLVLATAGGVLAAVLLKRG